MTCDQQNAILDARGTRRQVNEVTTTTPPPPPSVIKGLPTANVSVVTTEVASQAGT
jgi:hypothetical protein